MKTILVTGAAGFIGKNLVQRLRRTPEYVVHEFGVSDTDETLTRMCGDADAVFHLAGVNSSRNDDELFAGNAALTLRVVARLMGREHKPMLVLASSTQAALDTPYGRSKRKAEDALAEYAAVGGDAVIVRLPNVYGKWSRPNYVSIVATFCYDIARGIEVRVADPRETIDLVYIDDVVSAFAGLLTGGDTIGLRRIGVSPVTTITLGLLLDEICWMRDIRISRGLPDMRDRFRRSLYATYLTYLPEDGFEYPIAKKDDAAGAQMELLRSPHFGQLCVARTKPGCVRGHHYQDTKAGKVFVVEGTGILRFRHVISDAVVEYPVSGQDFSVLDIPPGYTHTIENTGERDLVVVCWSSEISMQGKSDVQPELMQP